MHLTAAKKGTAAGLLLLFLAGAAFGASPLARPQPAAAAASTQNWRSIQIANDKLERLQTVAGEFRKVGESIDLSLRSLPGNHASHSYKLNEAREKLNRAAVLLADLESMKHELEPWQRQAIERVTPIAAQAAAHTRAAIRHLNERPHARIVPEYTDQLRGIVDHSVAMKRTIDGFLDYADSQNRVQELEASLDIERS